MHFRTPDCRGGHYGTDLSATQHSPHDYFPTFWGEALVCLGWTQEEELASEAVEAVRQSTGASRLVIYHDVLMGINRILVPDSREEMEPLLTHQLTMLYGIPLVVDPSMRPGGWRIETDPPPPNPLAGGPVPRLEGDNIIKNWHYKGP